MKFSFSTNSPSTLAGASMLIGFIFGCPLGASWCALRHPSAAVAVPVAPPAPPAPLKDGDMVRHKLTGVKGQIIHINENGTYWVIWGDARASAESMTSPAIQWERDKE